MTTPPIKELLKFLGNFYDDNSFLGESDKALRFKLRGFPWNGGTCRTVVCYVVKFCSDDIMLSTMIRHLEMLTSEMLSSESSDESSILYMEKICAFFVDSFIPYVQKFFKLPRLEEEISDKANLPKDNELLAGFINFLLEILNSEAEFDSNEEDRYAILHKKLMFLLTILGDLPFQCTDHELEEVKLILAEFETLANEVGNFIYSCVFVTPHIKSNRFTEDMDAILEMLELLNVKIEEHCINFPKLLSRLSLTTPKAYDAIDSLFIVDSLLEDLESLIMNSQVELNIVNDDVKLQIKTLHEDLMFTRSLFNGADTRTDELKESLIQIRDVAYEVEYLLNSHIARHIPIWYLDVRFPSAFEKIKLIRTNLQEKTTKNYASEDVSFQDMGTPKVIVNNILVGFEDERREILSDLIGGSSKRQIVSIFGMAGLGKTTLAKKVYNDRSVIEKFDRRAWCVVSEKYQKKRVLRDILTGLSRNSNNNLNRGDENLGLEIYQTLKGRRYLIVIDDVWSLNLWDQLDRFFPDDANGSRIMFTSRIKDVIPTNSITHSLPFLTKDQSWRLLENKVFLEKSEPCPPQLVDIGKSIAAKCGGLPLALIVTGGVLANLDKEESVWEKIETNLNSYIYEDDTNDYAKIMELSFKHLPDHLKMCFLYLGNFPEDTEIPVRELIWLWIAEGFIHREQEKNPEQVAEKYLWDLISRSLVLTAGREYRDGGIKTCGIHDLLREMCLRIAHEQNFSKSMKDYSSIYEKHHRLCVPSEFRKGMGPFGLHCRSISTHDGNLSTCSFSQMKLLRVINTRLPLLDSYELLEMRPSLVDPFELKRNDYLLIQLRFLAYDILPHHIGRFINLEFLCVRTDENVYLPQVILKLPKLKHLIIKWKAKFLEDWDSSQTTNLRSLSRILIRNDKHVKSLRCSPRLRRLGCEFKGYNITECPDLRSFTELESLSMRLFYGHGRYFHFTKFTFPSTIKKLYLIGFHLPWEKTSIIGKLPNLHVLKIGRHAFDGEVWETRDGEFKELRFLKLKKLTLNQWITCSEHFPKLECLVVKCCFIEEIPRELGDITTLQTIKMIHCFRYEGDLSAVQIETEQHENANEDLNVFIVNREWSKEQLVRKCKEQASHEVDE